MINIHQTCQPCRSVECGWQPKPCQFLLLSGIHIAVPQCWLIVVRNTMHQWTMQLTTAKIVLLLTFSSITSVFAVTYNEVRLVVTWYNSSLWLAATPRQVHNLSKSKLYYFDLLWTCCRVHNKSTTNPQQLDMSRCCGFVVDFRFVVDLLWICCMQLVVQQIYNKSY